MSRCSEALLGNFDYDLRYECESSNRLDRLVIVTTIPDHQTGWSPGFPDETVTLPDGAKVEMEGGVFNNVLVRVGHDYVPATFYLKSDLKFDFIYGIPKASDQRISWWTLTGHCTTID